MNPRRRQKIRWSPELAYVVGLITTDGSLSIDGRHIILISKDVQLLETFKKILNLKNKIGARKSSYTGKKDCYHVQFGDVIFYKWLLGIGLTPNKTKTLRKLKIPNSYFFDFLRGYFDGDGTCYSYWDKRWHSSFMFYLSFASSNLIYLKRLKNQITRLLKINGHISVLHTRTYKLSYAKKGSKKIISKMYYKKNVPCLKRKYIKLKRILAIDNKEGNRA